MTPMDYLMTYDLGTGGLKAGLYRSDGRPAAFRFSPYPTQYLPRGCHEQRPDDWWKAVCETTRGLLADSGISPAQIAAVSSSGHSLVAAPLDKTGALLLKSVPIWSDCRAAPQAKRFFRGVDYEAWYQETGNGDPAENYSIFKLMWLRENLPDIWKNTSVVLGSKDYVHYRLTGRALTDYSYASGTGAFDLRRWRYDDALLAEAGIPREMLPDIAESHAVAGHVTREAAAQCGLREGTPVACGGVDNACMALGTLGIRNNRAYTSLGTSAWIAANSTEPCTDAERRPFIFAHIEKGYYTNGVSIFSAAGSYQWARDVLCADLGEAAYAAMDAQAALAKPGAGGLLFNPTLAGASPQEPGASLRGSFWGLSLASGRPEMLRAVLEGVAYSLKCYCLEPFKKMGYVNEAMVLCGGGAKSPLWMQIFADIFDMEIIRANVEQDAASLGAAAIAARGAGLWKDYAPLDELFEIRQSYRPQEANRAVYQSGARRFRRWTGCLAKLDEQEDGVL